MYTVSVVNQKGGVGKTTTTIACATAMHHRDIRVLVIDLDSSMNTTAWCLGRHLEPNEASIYDSLVAQKRGAEGEADWPLADLIEESQLGFDYVPANRDLSAADAELANEPFLLADRLEQLDRSLREPDGDGAAAEIPAERAYDFCLIDCPPSLGTLVYVALIASSGLIIPLGADQFSLDGLSQLLTTFRKARRVNSDLEILGLLLNNLDHRYGLTGDLVEQLETAYGDKVFETKVPARARIREAPMGVDILDHASGSDVVKIYNDVVDELLERTGHTDIPSDPETDGEESDTEAKQRSATV